MAKIKPPAVKSPRLQYVEVHGNEVLIEKVSSVTERLGANKRLCILLWDYQKRGYVWLFYGSQDIDTVREILRALQTTEHTPGFWEITLEQELSMIRLA